MPVIINDFEIVVEPPEKPGPTEGAGESSPDNAPTIRPDDLVRVMQLHDERMARVRAD